MTSSIFSTKSTPFYIVLSDGNNFCHIYFTSALMRDTAKLLAEYAEEIGGDVLGIVPNGFTRDRWFCECEKRYANMRDFYGWPELPE